jgi:CheY-like chemotaxis protein
MRRILVVDDDPHVGQAIRVWLKHDGFRVGHAFSAIETPGLEFLRLATQLGAAADALEPTKSAAANGDGPPGTGHAGGRSS